MRLENSNTRAGSSAPSFLVGIRVLVAVGMQWVVGVEEEVAEAERRLFHPLGALAFLGQRLELEGFLAQNAQDGFTPRDVARQRVLRVLRPALDRILQNVDAVAR